MPPSHTIDWPVNDPHILTITVQPQDIDGLGHANNGRYIAWCERAAWQHSELLGLNVRDFQNLNRAMALHHSEYDYLLPAVEDDQLQVATWLSLAHGSRMSREFRIARTTDGKIIFSALWQLVCIELSTHKPKRLPAEFIKVYGPAVKTA